MEEYTKADEAADARTERREVREHEMRLARWFSIVIVIGVVIVCLFAAQCPVPP